MTPTDPLLSSGPGQTWHEPDYFQQFQCLATACEDTCCGGWGIGVDRHTHNLYQDSTHPVLGPQLRNLVTIQAAPTSNHFSTIQLQDAQCPFLSEKLCGVQQELGEGHLAQACATFPRVVNRVEGAIERSLDLSCPEAARIALLNPQPDFFVEFSGTLHSVDQRMMDVVAGRAPQPPTSYMDEMRGFAIAILQNRSYPVAKRMLLLSHFCSKLSELAENGTQFLIPQVIEGFQYGIQAKLFDDHLNQVSAEPSSQLAIVLELVIGRVSLDYTAPRYRELYNEFIQGLNLRSDSNIFELGERYAEAYFQYFDPFMQDREHILEHYLVSYAYKNLFPCGAGSIDRQYMLLASYFATTRSLAVGLAGHYREAFTEAHVVRAIQVCARALEHCTSYPDRVMEILASKGIVNAAAMGVLTQNLTQPAWAHDGFVTRRMKATA